TRTTSSRRCRPRRTPTCCAACTGSRRTPRASHAAMCGCSARAPSCARSWPPPSCWPMSGRGRGRASGRTASASVRGTRAGGGGERESRLQPGSIDRVSHVARLLAGADPVVAATDYVRAWPQLIAEYVDARYVTLGTDGFGRSDTRSALRRFFEVDRHHVVL